MHCWPSWPSLCENVLVPWWVGRLVCSDSCPKGLKPQRLFAATTTSARWAPRCWSLTMLKPFARVRSDNYIGALGAAVLANALKGNAALTGLHIKGNELGNEGVKALCEAFRAREGRVTALDFGNNRRESHTGVPCFHLGLVLN